MLTSIINLKTDCRRDDEIMNRGRTGSPDRVVSVQKAHAVSDRGGVAHCEDFDVSHFFSENVEVLSHLPEGEASTVG